MAFLIELLWGLNVIMCRKCFACSLAQEKHSINFWVVGQWQPKGAKKTRKDVSEGPIRIPLYMEKKTGNIKGGSKVWSLRSGNMKG